MSLEMDRRTFKIISEQKLTEFNPNQKIRKQVEEESDESMYLFGLQKYRATKKDKCK
jgi:hypothetical protein